MAYVIAVLIGLVAGSFFSVVLTRLGREDGIVAGRSRCPRCRVVLRWFELVPLVSFVAQWGRCRHCHGRVPLAYPALELVTATAVVALAWAYGPTYSLADTVVAFVALGLLLLALFDARELILPDIILASVGGVWLAYAALSEPGLIVQRAPVAFVLAGIFAILYVVSRGEWVGFGDVKLLLLIGFLFGYPTAVVVAITAVWIAAFVGGALVLLRGATLKTALPFGTFLATTALAALIFHAPLRALTRLFW